MLATRGDWDVIERLTPSRVAAIRRVVAKAAEAPQDPTSPPPMNEAEMLRYTQMTDGKIPGVGMG